MSARPDELETLRAQLAERDRRLNQLESRLSLLEASQRELRYALADRAPESVRVSAAAEERDGPVARSAVRGRSGRSSAVPEREEARPLLRLYEERSSKGSTPSERADLSAEAGISPTRPALMPVPVVSERLPIAPVPSLASIPQEGTAGARDPADQYRRAIDLLRQREFSQALALLDDLLARFPADPRAAKAMFWRGEVLFAQRDYGAALQAYQSSLGREPRGEKAADSLLKIGLCHRQLGAPERAHEALQRLRTQFPESAAARLLSEEDA